MISALTEKDSKTIYCVRCFAILSTISAHLTNQMSVNSYMEQTNATVWTLFGNVGVITFLIFGGFLYYYPDGDGKGYWKKKLQTLVLPWFCSAILTYAVFAVLEEQFSLSGLLRWIIGSGSWYYYVTVYLFCLMGFRYIYKKPMLLWLCVVVTTISLWLTYKGFLKLENKIITNYLNVLNWIGFFALGVLARHYWKTIRNCTFIWLSIPMCIVLGVYLSSNNILSYFHPIGALFELFGCVCLVLLGSIVVRIDKAEMLIRIGKCSYFIYLWHMQIVQKLCNLLPKELMFDVVRPLVGLLIMVILLDTCHIMAKKIPGGRLLVKMLALPYDTSNAITTK